MLDMRGQSRITTLIYLMVAIVVIYVLIKMVPPYMHYYSMDDEVHQQLKLSKINNPDVIRNDILDKARELDLEIYPEDLELTYDDEDNLDIYVYWEDEVDFGYGIVQYFEFEIDTSAGDYEEE